MLIEKIREKYAEKAETRIPKGNPTASRFGRCAAQSQMLLHPDVSHPVEPQPRGLMVMDEGHLIEQWWAKAIEEAYPLQAGLAEELFYFPVPLDEAAVKTVYHRIKARKLWGTIAPGFQPPSIRQAEDGRVKVKLAPRDRDGKGPAKMGFVLDPAAAIVYAPVYVDRIIRHPDLGLVVLEKKAVSNYSFRRSLLGQIDYEKRCQLAGIVAATGLSACWLLYRKETAHLAEILYTQRADRVRVQFTKLNGQAEVYFVDGPETVVNERGEPAELPGEATWEIAATWTPYDAGLLEAIRARIRRVLLVGAEGPWHREYGPTFTCQKCEGKGTRVCPQCKGTGVTPKLGKPCGPCKGAKTVTCESCDGKGQLERVELPSFPCGYCPVVATCYPFATLELDTKPHYWVMRADWEAKGLTFTPPEGPAPAAPVAAPEAA